MRGLLQASSRQMIRTELITDTPARVRRVPPQEIVEQIKLLERGHIPVPVIDVRLSTYGETCLVWTKENWEKFLLVYHARISFVPIRVLQLTIEERQKLVDFRAQVFAEMEQRPRRWLDDNQLDAEREVREQRRPRPNVATT